jgi:hypothetical protein
MHPLGYAQRSAASVSPGPTGFEAAPQKKKIGQFLLFLAVF